MIKFTVDDTDNIIYENGMFTGDGLLPNYIRAITSEFTPVGYLPVNGQLIELFRRYGHSIEIVESTPPLDFDASRVY